METKCIFKKALNHWILPTFFFFFPFCLKIKSDYYVSYHLITKTNQECITHWTFISVERFEAGWKSHHLLFVTASDCRRAERLTAVCSPSAALVHSGWRLDSDRVTARHHGKTKPGSKETRLSCEMEGKTVSSKRAGLKENTRRNNNES